MTAILRSVAEVREWRRSIPGERQVGFVPTMGALHAGHLSLVELAQKRGAVTITSIFVNPLQFGPGEDLTRYPRPIDEDVLLLRAAGADALFLPEVADLYAQDASTFVVEEAVSAPLCGAGRPGHFRGVTTVVLKLINIVQPHFLVLGQKDAQQCAVLERMMRDLHVPVEIIRGSIVREADGLALSSRNLYLSPEEREVAPAIYASLLAAKSVFDEGERSAGALAKAGRSVLEGIGILRVQYWDVCHPRTLNRTEDVGADGALLAVAAQVGGTRLIDNLVLVPA